MLNVPEKNTYGDFHILSNLFFPSLKCSITFQVMFSNLIFLFSALSSTLMKQNEIVWTAERIASRFYPLCVCLLCFSLQMSTMPGLPTRPCFYDIDLDPVTEEITGLFWARSGRPINTNTHKYFSDTQIPIWAFPRRLLQICCDLSAFFNTHWQNCFSLRVSLTASLAPVFLSVGINRFHSHGRSPVPIILQRPAVGRPHPLHLLNQTLQFSPCTALTC